MLGFLHTDFTVRNNLKHWHWLSMPHPDVWIWIIVPSKIQPLIFSCFSLVCMVFLLSFFLSLSVFSHLWLLFCPMLCLCPLSSSRSPQSVDGGVAQGPKLLSSPLDPFSSLKFNNLHMSVSFINSCVYCIFFPSLCGLSSSSSYE